MIHFLVFFLSFHNRGNKHFKTMASVENLRTAFKKEYLPGYTGHVPFKKEIYGCSLGDINRIVTGKPVLKSTTFVLDERRSKPTVYNG